MRKKVILVVDDTPENIDVLSGVSRSAFKVKAALNGERAELLPGVGSTTRLSASRLKVPGSGFYRMSVENAYRKAPGI